MSKEKPQILRSDVDELFDRNRVSIANFIDFAVKNDAEVTIRVTPKGDASVKVFEKTNNYALFKEVTESPTSYKYQEINQKI